ncbi:hypothetical protein C8Q80DRAFT_1274770 [Daedaleopsis nitida]|nr:hypothetical protein C8Q80DRAFT_1274770 [Daedaleopsis nitida]
MISRLIGGMGVGHVQYLTAGSSNHVEVQPFYVNSPYERESQQHIIHFVDAVADRHINTTLDTELLLDMFAESRQPMKDGKAHRPLPLAFRHFQTASAIAARSNLAKNHKVRRATGAPSPAELSLHQCRIRPDILAAQDRQEALEQVRLWEPLRANLPFYIHKELLRDAGYGASRGARNDAPRIVYLSTKTLVVVPDDLQLQWENEVIKHTTDLLRVLRVPRRDELLDAPVLATDYNVPERHTAQKKAVGDLASRTTLNVRRCRCSRRENVLPLLEIFWKRLIVDERHNAAEKRTNYALLTRLLRPQCRAALGRDLMALDFCSGCVLQHPHEDEDEEEDARSDQRKRRRRWHNRERLDFHKLGTMFGEALIVMPFASDPKASSTLIVNPLFGPDGPWPCHTAVLTQAMASVAVRHRYEDVGQEATVLATPHGAIGHGHVRTYNLIQATIAISPVDSERKD